MIKIFVKLIVLPALVILIALSFTVSAISKIYYLAGILVNAVFMLCAVIALLLQQWNNFGIAVVILGISWILMKMWNVIEYGIGIMYGCLLNYFHN